MFSSRGPLQLQKKNDINLCFYRGFILELLVFKFFGFQI